MNPTTTQWKYLDRKPGSRYLQLVIKGRNIFARTLYGQYLSAEDPMTMEQIAANRELPLEAVQEAIAYCQSNPPEIERDFRREEAAMEMTGMNEPGYKYNPRPRPLTAEQREILRNM